MIRKRQNSKDYTYDHFGIKPSQYLKFQEDVIVDKKSYILQTLGIEEKPIIDNNELHLLTNPI
jgi:hypothetical protein